MRQSSQESNIIRWHPRALQLTHAELFTNGDINLHNRLQLNNSYLITRNTWDLLPQSHNDFNLFWCVGLLLNAVTQIKFDYNNLNYESNWYDEKLFQRSRYRAFYEFVYTRIGHYTRNKVDTFAQTFASKYDTNNAYSFRLQPRFGMSKPNIQCFVNSHIGDLQTNVSYDFYIYMSILSMFCNETNMICERFAMNYDTLVCDLKCKFKNVVTVYPYKYTGTPPHFPSSNDFEILKQYNELITMDDDDFKVYYQKLESNYYKELLCILRIGCFYNIGENTIDISYMSMFENEHRKFIKNCLNYDFTNKRNQHIGYNY